MYANNHKLVLPRGALSAGAQNDDWIYWQSNRKLSDSMIAPYLDVGTLASVFRCPSDDLSFRVRGGANAYFYSYSRNSLMQEIKLTSIRASAGKMLLYEEAAETIDDGYGTPQPGGSINLLSIRHDSSRQNPDNVTTGLTLNGACRGNALFCDGHAEYIDRKTLHSQPVYDPNY